MIIGRAGRRVGQRLKIIRIDPEPATEPVSQTPITDTTPDQFSFINITGAIAGTTLTSNTITVSGLSSGTLVLAVISGDATSEFQKNGGAWQTATVSVQNGDTLAVRHTAAFSVVTTLTVGGVSANFTSSTVGGAGQPAGLLLAITKAS